MVLYDISDYLILVLLSVNDPLFIQDTLRYLVQDSLATYKRMIIDACHDVMNVEEDLDWGNDIVNSPYKYVYLL